MMNKLVVEVHDASNLMPKDGKGLANPFVQINFDEQQVKTQTKHKDLNPYFNEKFVFNINTSRDLSHQTIEVVVFNHNEKKPTSKKNLLGKVRISGNSIPYSESESSVKRYPLEHSKGDIALKMFAFHDPFANTPPPPNPHPPPQHSQAKSNSYAEILEPDPDEEIPLQEINTNIHMEDEESMVSDSEKKKKNKKKKEKEVRTFHSIGTEKPSSHGHGHGHGHAHAHGHSHAPASAFAPVHAAKFPSFVSPTVETQTRVDLAKSGPSNVMLMQIPRQNPEYALVETAPPLAARLRYKGGNKVSTTYDLVEQMHFLYVNVVKAKDLPVMDITGSLDPYVEVKLGNYKGVTKHLDKNQHPVWKQIFAFSKERLQSNLLEVTVKDKDIGKDDFVGRIMFDLTEMPVRVPPDSPLAPQWYRLEDKKGMKIHNGEIMLAVWMGTQADESFPEAWHSDAHNISHHNLANTRSKVYFTPKLYYLRVEVIEAQDLVPSDKGRIPQASVRVQLGSQMRFTRPSQMRAVNPIWNEELMFVAAEPFEEFIIVTVEDKFGPNNIEILGREIMSVRNVPQRMETGKLPDSRWFNLHRPSAVGEEETERKKEKFSSKIHLRICLEAGYHVLDESTHFSSDLQPSSKHLRKRNIGILEVGILSARNLLPMKGKDGRTTDAYCVAKYGNKWVRTRTLLDTLSPRWNEQYTWEVHDPCTVITVSVFDNHHINGSSDNKDQRIGKVRIRLSTLETDRVYTHYYPLLVLQPNGLKKNGELHLAVRFTCTAWVNMVAQYGRPLLPKMHYVQPIPVRHIDWLRYQAMQIVAARLARAEPPLRRESVEYMLDVDYHMWSLRRSKANFHRIMSLLSGFTAVCKWLNDICTWRNPVTTCLVHVLFLILVCYPELILPTIFLYLFVIGIWNYRFRPRNPPHMDARLSQAEAVHPDELDEEFDTFPTTRPSDIVRMRYDRLRSVAGRVQTVVGDLATQGERAQAILSWRDSRATSIFIIFSLIWAVFIYITPFQVIAIIVGIFMLRHPRFRSKMPSVPVNFFKRLPSKSDSMF